MLKHSKFIITPLTKLIHARNINVIFAAKIVQKRESEREREILIKKKPLEFSGSVNAFFMIS